MKARYLWTSGLITICALFWSGMVWAQALPNTLPDLAARPGYTLETILEWFEKYKDAQPDFKAPMTFRQQDLSRLAPFMPPGIIEEYDFPELELRLVETSKFESHPLNREATEKYAGQTKVTPDCTLENYHAGHPFSPEELDPNDPLSGCKAIWNYESRWMPYGTWIDRVQWVWVSRGGSHADHPLAQSMPGVYPGQGAFGRTIALWYQRFYYTHSAIYGTENNYTAPGIEDAGQYFWKEYDHFFEPYDVRGTRFLQWRYDDARRADDAWVYVPALRRVRRVSAEVKSDSLLGTDYTLEDFYAFSGRVPVHEWKFLGWKTIVTQWNPKQYPHVKYGPISSISTDDYEVRRAAVILGIPKSERHPYSAKVMFVDPESWNNYYNVIFDKAGKLWKVNVWYWYNTEVNPGALAEGNAEHNKGRHAVMYYDSSMIDIQRGTATIATDLGDEAGPTAPPQFGYRAMTPSTVNDIFDLNRLTEGKR